MLKINHFVPRGFAATGNMIQWTEWKPSSFPLSQCLRPLHWDPRTVLDHSRVVRWVSVKSVFKYFHKAIGNLHDFWRSIFSVKYFPMAFGNLHNFWRGCLFFPSSNDLLKLFTWPTSWHLNNSVRNFVTQGSPKFDRGSHQKESSNYFQ